MRTARLSAAIAALTAGVISIGMPGVAVAATWSGPINLWSPGAPTEAIEATGLVALDADTVVVGYSARLSTGTHNVYARRSTDGGTTWAPPVQVSQSGKNGQTLGLGGISGYGAAVDLAWWEPDTGGNAHIEYSRSSDGGATFSKPVALSKLDNVSVPTVGRGPNGVVAVVWHSRTRAKVFVRVSHNGGQTFAARQELWKTTETPGYMRHFAVAVADDVIYVANSRANGIQIRRSFDGVHWGSRTQVAWYPSGLAEAGYTWPVSLTAEGNAAFIGFIRYTKKGRFVPSYRRTVDNGASWSVSYSLGAASTELKHPLVPLMSLDNGVVRTVFGWGGVLYRESTDGISWSAPELASGAAFFPTPIGVGFTDSVVIAYYRPDYLEARTASP